MPELAAAVETLQRWGSVRGLVVPMLVGMASCSPTTRARLWAAGGLAALLALLEVNQVRSMDGCGQESRLCRELRVCVCIFFVYIFLTVGGRQPGSTACTTGGEPGVGWAVRVGLKIGRVVNQELCVMRFEWAAGGLAALLVLLKVNQVQTVVVG